MHYFSLDRRHLAQTVIRNIEVNTLENKETVECVTCYPCGYIKKKKTLAPDGINCQIDLQ
jgi:hypothetical protein